MRLRLKKPSISRPKSASILPHVYGSLFSIVVFSAVTFDLVAFQHLLDELVRGNLDVLLWNAVKLVLGFVCFVFGGLEGSKVLRFLVRPLAVPSVVPELVAAVPVTVVQKRPIRRPEDEKLPLM